MPTKTSGYNKQMQAIARLYREETGIDEMNLDVMFEWAIQHKLYRPREITLRRRFKREMSRALGRETKEDPQGRTVKANHAYRVPVSGGQWEWDWAPIETIKPQHMSTSLTLRRDAMVATAVQHHIDWASYNDNNVHGAQLPEQDYNFNLDIEESLLPDEYPESAPAS